MFYYIYYLQWSSVYNKLDNPCHWHGITCIDGHIISIVLNDNNLQGDLPQSMSALSHMRSLELAGNGLIGSGR